jgi:phosphoribosylamine---glycine ligase
MPHNHNHNNNGFIKPINSNAVIAEKPLNFLFVSWEDMSGDLAWQLTREGHKIKFYTKEPTAPDIFSGFFERISSWEEFVDWADIVIFDDTGFGKAAEKLRKHGKAVIGGNDYTDNLEEDREFGQTEMAKVGMSVLPYQTFTNFDDAIKFIKENPMRLVFKPSGSVLSSEKSILFVGEEESGSDILEVLERNKKTWGKKIKRFQLQKYMQGVEVAVGAFFNGSDFIFPININFEHKRLFPGDIGPSTGEMGTLMYWSEANRIFQLTLEKLKQRLQETDYIGYIDINCIANNNGVYPLEITSRFGYPTISIQMEGILNSAGDWIAKLARGESFTLRTKKGFQVGIVVAAPPFPYEDDKASDIYKDSTIVFKRQNFDGIHLGDDIKLVENEFRLCGNGGYVLIVTGSGMTVAEARKLAYNRIKNIILQNKFYRTDIGLRWNTDSDKLQSWGYLY